MIDEIDCTIIECLKKNARMKLSEIARRVNLSLTATADRVRRLEQSGVVRGYGVILDESRLGRDLTALISVRLEHPRYNAGFIEMIRQHPDILECHYVTGDYDFNLKVVTNGGAGLEQLLNYIKGVSGVSLTRTLVVLSTVKDEMSVTPSPMTK